MVDLNPYCLLPSLDIESIFTYVPLEETIHNIIINDLFCTTDKVYNFEKDVLKQPLKFAAYVPFLCLIPILVAILMVLSWDLHWDPI